MWRTVILLLAACTDPAVQAFVVDGFIDVPMQPRGSVVAIWELPGSPVRFFKFGDGPTLGNTFTLGFPTEPPPGALTPDGIGVAYVVMLPELTTLPDGPVSLAALPSFGISSDSAIVYKTATATGPAWSTDLPLRFTCARCVRDGAVDRAEASSALDRFVQQPCSATIVELATDRCQWF